MPVTHRLFLGLLLGISVALPACSASDAQGPKPGASQPAVPGHHRCVVQKAMPLDASVVGTVEAYFDRRRPRADHRRADRRQLQAGRRRAGGAGAVHARPPAARSGAAPGRGQPRARHRAGRQREGHRAALSSDLVERGIAHASSATPRARASAALEATRRRRSRRGREREGAAAVRRRSARRSPGAPAR